MLQIKQEFNVPKKTIPSRVSKNKMKRSESNGPASSTSESIEYIPSPESDGIRRHQFVVGECVRNDFHFSFSKQALA